MTDQKKTNKPSEEKLKSFWKWFSENEKLIREVLEDTSHPEKNALVQSLDNYVLDFGMFTWEIGNGKEKPYYFTISPNGDKELLVISKFIIRSAPEITGWEFNYAKAPKEGGLHFSLYDENMLERDIDATSWKFVLIPLPNKNTKVIIEAENISHLDDETKLQACDIALTTILGEEKKMNELHEIELVFEFSEEHKAKGAEITELFKLLAAQ